MSAYIFIKPTDEIFKKFDNYEIGACVLLNPSNPTRFDRCGADNPDIAFWRVFGHLKTGGLECISDHETYEEAIEFMDTLPPMPRTPITPF
jgi:hypothetical protein